MVILKRSNFSVHDKNICLN